MDKKTTKALVKGLFTYIPGAIKIVRSVRGHNVGRGSHSKYCYSIWLRMLKICQKNQLDIPKSIGELGPGNSMGIGIMALLTGSKKYISLDFEPYTSIEENLIMLDELVSLLRKRENIPNDDGYPRVNMLIDNYDFPHDILPDDKLDVLLSDTRIKNIREAIKTCGNTDSNNTIRYIAPWMDYDFQGETFDFVFSLHVMEHVDDLEYTYKKIESILKFNGIMAHDIDFYSHDLSDKWNGHWAFSPLKWKIIRGKRPYMLNRATLKHHLDLIDENNFSKITSIITSNDKGYSRGRLAKKYKNLDDDILTTSGCFLLYKRN